MLPILSPSLNLGWTMKCYSKIKEVGALNFLDPSIQGSMNLIQASRKHLFKSLSVRAWLAGHQFKKRMPNFLKDSRLLL